MKGLNSNSIHNRYHSSHTDLYQYFNHVITLCDVWTPLILFRIETERLIGSRQKSAVNKCENAHLLNNTIEQRKHFLRDVYARVRAYSRVVHLFYKTLLGVVLQLLLKCQLTFHPYIVQQWFLEIMRRGLGRSRPVGDVLLARATFDCQRFSGAVFPVRGTKVFFN